LLFFKEYINKIKLLKVYFIFYLLDWFRLIFVENNHEKFLKFSIKSKKFLSKIELFFYLSLSIDYANLFRNIII